MRTTFSFVFLLLILIGNSFSQELYPKFYEAGKKIDFTPGKNVYVITESQLDSCLKINALYKNCEQRIALLRFKIEQQDSMMKLLRLKEVNFDSTLAHTSQKLNQCTDEAEGCQKDLVKQKSCKKILMGLSGLEAVVLILVLAL